MDGNEILWFLDQIKPVYRIPKKPSKLYTIYDEKEWIENEINILNELYKSGPDMKEPDWDSFSSSKDRQDSWSNWYKYTTIREESINCHIQELLNENHKIKHLIDLYAEKRGLEEEFLKLRSHNSNGPIENQLIAEQMTILDNRIYQLNDAVEQIKTYNSIDGFDSLSIEYGNHLNLRDSWESIDAVKVSINNTELPKYINRHPEDDLGLGNEKQTMGIEKISDKDKFRVAVVDALKLRILTALKDIKPVYDKNKLVLPLTNEEALDMVLSVNKKPFKDLKDIRDPTKKLNSRTFWRASSCKLALAREVKSNKFKEIRDVVISIKFN